MYYSIIKVTNKKTVNFLDVTFNLNSEKYEPFMKPENRPLYINTKSNHLPAVIRAVPEGVNKRLAEISSDQPTFQKAIPPYQTALKNSGYTHELKYDKGNSKGQERRRNKKRHST